MPLSPRRRTPSDAILEHTPSIDERMSKLRRFIQKQKIEAKAGRSTWCDVTSIATLDEALRNIGEYTKE